METEVYLPPQCKFRQDGEMVDFFVRTTCNLQLCTTDLGACSISGRGCCCRAIKTEPIDVECEEDSFISGYGVNINETNCGCAICDDIEVHVTVLVHEPGEDGKVISGAQVINKHTGELLGLTFVNGIMSFSSLVGDKTISIIVIAAGYLPREHKIYLMPTRNFIETSVALIARNPVAVAPDASGYTFRLGDYVFITIPADGFMLNGSIYNDVVLFDGMFMDSSDGGFLDLVDGNQLVLNDLFFSLSFVTHIIFTTLDGDNLEAQTMNYFIESDTPLDDSFLVTYNPDSEQWLDLGEVVTATDVPIQKRQNGIYFVQLNTAINTSFIFHAEVLANVSCWLQLRSFQQSGIPAQGLVGSVTQMGRRADGMGFAFTFGTNTGAAQSNNDMLTENAICLPLACDGFTMGTVEGNIVITQLSPAIPVDFPPGTFNASEIGAPTPLGRFFVFQEVITSTPNQLRPFYASVEECISAGMIDSDVANPMSFFYFIQDLLVFIPNTETCFVKIRTIECLQSGVNRVIFVSGSSGIQNAFLVGYDELVDEMFSASHFDDLCTEASRVVCIPFACNTRFQVNVRDDDIVSFCNISVIAPIAQSPLIQLSDNPQSILLATEDLAEQDYNNPDLGMYYDPDPQVAEQLCLDPSDLSATQASSEGFAVTFDCLG